MQTHSAISRLFQLIAGIIAPAKPLNVASGEQTAASGGRVSTALSKPTEGRLSRLRKWWRGLDLTQQFALAGASVVLLGISAIGTWLSEKIEAGVTSHSAAAAALYMDAFIAPLAQDLSKGNVISPENKKKLDEIMAQREISENVLSVKIWQKGGLIAYSNFEEIIGRTFTPTPYLKEAWNGVVSAHISDLGHDDDTRERMLGVELIEIYAPIRESHSNRIIAVSEFYMRANGLQESLRKAQLQSWAVVGTTGLLMLLALYGIVRRGSSTIEQQRLALVRRAEQNHDLRQRIEDAYWRADRLNEQFLRRLGADLHDGPAQLLGFALMRLDDLPIDRSAIEDSQEPTHEVVRSALEDAIKDIRSLSRGLILPELDTITVNETIALVARLHEERTKSTVAFDLPAEPVEASKEIKVCTYRFVQEALTNSFKHAGGSGQKIVMEACGKYLTIEVRDEGPGVGDKLNVSPLSQHLGLLGIRDRIETLAGHFNIHSPAHGGTLLRMTLDLSRAPRPEEPSNG